MLQPFLLGDTQFSNAKSRASDVELGHWWEWNQDHEKDTNIFCLRKVYLKKCELIFQSLIVSAMSSNRYEFRTHAFDIVDCDIQIYDILL